MIHLGDRWYLLDGQVICPDELRLEQLGEADRLRGRVVRAFFWLLDRLLPRHRGVSHDPPLNAITYRFATGEWDDLGTAWPSTTN